MAITVATAAGLINVSVVFFQCTFPLLFTFVLVGFTAHTSNAATWSVTGRLLGGTWWPTILRTDEAVVTHVRKRIMFLSTISTVIVLLLGVAAVVTPIGLYDSLSEVSDGSIDVVYVKDTSPIGSAMLNRDKYNTTRLCGYVPVAKPCPGQYHGFNFKVVGQDAFGDVVNITSNGPQDYISSTISSNMTDIFSTGRDGNLGTVATPFDIQYRAYILDITPNNATDTIAETLEPSPAWNIDQQNPRTIGSLQMYENSLTAMDYVIRDGIIADMKSGGIGFRNHTLPKNAATGIQWTESLLWIEPQTVCVDSNVSLKFKLPSYQDKRDIEYKAENYLIDHGGLSAAIAKGATYGQRRVQIEHATPDLFQNAEIGASLYNYNLALYLQSSTKNSEGQYVFNRSTDYVPGMFMSGEFQTDLLVQGYLIRGNDNITSQRVVDIDVRTNAVGSADRANRSWTAMKSGVVLGSPRSVDSTWDGRADPGGSYVAPFFTCSTALQAYVKDITFFVNSTSTIQNLQVKEAAPRTYASGKEPLWAVEKPGPGFRVIDMNSLWGIVGEEHKDNTNFWIQRSERLYLPAGKALYTGVGDDTSENFAAFDSDASAFPVQGLSMLYSLAYTPDAAPLTNEKHDAPYYTGLYSYPLVQKWSNLTQSTTTVPTVMALIWTDLMVNTLTSRRSQLNAKYQSVSTAEAASRQDVPSTVPVAVQYYRHTVRYKTVFAIPAIIFLTAYLALLVCAVVLRVSKRTSFTTLRSYLNQTSVGRAVMIARYAVEDASLSARIKNMSTSAWVKEFGAEDIGIRRDARYELLDREAVHPKSDSQ